MLGSLGAVIFLLLSRWGSGDKKDMFENAARTCASVDLKTVLECQVHCVCKKLEDKGQSIPAGGLRPYWWLSGEMEMMAPLSLQDGRWYGSQPGQLFCAMPDGDCFLCPRAWNSLESVALNRLCKTVWGAVQLRTGWVGASLGRLGGRMFQNEGAFAKALKKERIIVSLGQREGGEWSSRAQWHGNKCQAAPPERRQAQRAASGALSSLGKFRFYPECSGNALQVLNRGTSWA